MHTVKVLVTLLALVTVSCVTEHLEGYLTRDKKLFHPLYQVLGGRDGLESRELPPDRLPFFKVFIVEPFLGEGLLLKLFTPERVANLRVNLYVAEHDSDQFPVTEIFEISVFFAFIGLLFDEPPDCRMDSGFDTPPPRDSLVEIKNPLVGVFFTEMHG